jgi:hypothetical protein
MTNQMLLNDFQLVVVFTYFATGSLFLSAAVLVVSFLCTALARFALHANSNLMHGAYFEEHQEFVVDMTWAICYK